MRGTSSRLMVLLVTLLLALTVAACGGDDDEATDTDGAAVDTQGDEGGQGGTLVFAGAADPVALDGALVSDGESLRAVQQIFETLVGLEEGGTAPVPKLAASWEPNEDGTVWTFALQEGVTFHDGTPFNAEAVCFNFDRWYNFSGPLQNPSASYYWQVVFGGFAEKENPDAPDESLYQSCEATDDLTAVITLTQESATFIPALAQASFSIASPEALVEFEADAGTVDEEGVFQPAGTFGIEHPVGTGPFMFESWSRGESLTLAKYDDYWGEPAKLDTLIFRPIGDNAARLQALQSGDIQGYDLVEPQDIEVIEADSSLQILDRPAFNVAYVGINVGTPPMDDPNVRRAFAHGLDRQSVVDAFYAGRAEVAKNFMPPALEGYAEDVTTYDYDPELSKQLLEEAGLTLPVKIDFWYPSDVSRPYMPDPKRNFEAFAASLNEAGFEVVPKTAPWSPDYLGSANEGKLPVFLLGWTGDYGDADNFLGTFFQTPQAQWGTTENPNQEVHELLAQAEIETDQATRVALYEQANQLIADWIPGVPYAHSQPALAFRSDVQGFVPNPTTNETFATVYFAE